MGHYDSFRASEDFSKMSAKEKKPYIDKFKKHLKKDGFVQRYFDEVDGHILNEWAKDRKGLVDWEDSPGMVSYCTPKYSKKITEKREKARIEREAAEEKEVEEFKAALTPLKSLEILSSEHAGWLERQLAYEYLRPLVEKI